MILPEAICWCDGLCSRQSDVFLGPWSQHSYAVFRAGVGRAVCKHVTLVKSYVPHRPVFSVKWGVISTILICHRFTGLLRSYKTLKMKFLWGIKSALSEHFILWGSKITADGDFSHEIKRHLLLGRKVKTNLDSILKSKDITLPTKVHLVKAMIFPIVMYGCES